MSTRYLTRAAVLAALVLCGTAHAAEAWHQDYVKWIYPLSNGNFVLAFASSPATCTNANSPKYFYVSVGTGGVTIDGARAMFASALLAFATGKKLNVAFEGGSSSCDVNRLLISD